MQCVLLRFLCLVAVFAATLSAVTGITSASANILAPAAQLFTERHYFDASIAPRDNHIHGVNAIVRNDYAAMEIEQNGRDANRFRAGDIVITDAWTRATAPGAKTGGAFLTLTNSGSMQDRLVGAVSDVAQTVQLHRMSIEKGVMRMRRLENGLVIEPGASVRFKPGGFHLMLIGLLQTFGEGEVVRITLVFEKAGMVDVVFAVEQIGLPDKHHKGR